MATKYLSYTTKQGDTFDIIALKYYNNEKYASLLMQNNVGHIGTIVFPRGVTLKIPVIVKSAQSTLPPWKR